MDTITFQAQMDLTIPKKQELTQTQLNELLGEFNIFLSKLEKYRVFVRGDMYVNEKSYHFS